MKKSGTYTISSAIKSLYFCSKPNNDILNNITLARCITNVKIILIFFTINNINKAIVPRSNTI